MQVESRPIAFVRSPYQSVQGMPIQTAAAPNEKAWLEVLPEYSDGLLGIDDFEYLILITHLHKGVKESLQVVPFLDDQPHGVFATRAPARPNKLGLSIVRLTERDGLHLHFTGNDMLDGTPVLDIKPYVPEFDIRQTERVGWYKKKLQDMNATRSDSRMER